MAKDKVWKEMRLDVAQYVTQVRHPALDREQQGRLALAWPAIYLDGAQGEEEWRCALGYETDAWQEVRGRFAMALPSWELRMITAENGRQREVSETKRANRLHSESTNGNGREHPSTAVHVAVAVASAVESEKEEPTHLSPDGDERPIVKTSKRRKTPTTNNQLDRDWMETFDEVWWPDYLSLGRKCSKAAAREVWAKIPHPDGQTDFDRLMDAYSEAKAEWTSKHSEVRFIPHAETWLRDYLKNLLLEE